MMIAIFSNRRRLPWLVAISALMLGAGVMVLAT